MSPDKEKVIATWETAFPLVTNRFYLYDMVKILVWTFLLIMVLMVISLALAGNLDNWTGILTGFGIALAIMAVLILLVTVTFFGNRFPTRFTLTEKRVLWASRSRVGRNAGRLAIIAGLLEGKPGVAGAGFLAVSGEKGGLAWENVRRYKEYPAERVISIRNSWRVVIRLYCTPENYRAVAESVKRLAANAVQKG